MVPAQLTKGNCYSDDWFKYKITQVSRIVAFSESSVSELICDINTEIYPLEMGQKFTLMLVRSLTENENESQDKATWKGDFKSLADEYEYVMYGKVYKYDDSVSGKMYLQ